MGQSSNCHCFRIGSQFNCHWGSIPHFQTISYYITCDTWYVYETHSVRRIVDRTRNIPKKIRQRGSRMSKRWIDEILPHTSHTFPILSCTFSIYLWGLGKKKHPKFLPSHGICSRTSFRRCEVHAESFRLYTRTSGGIESAASRIWLGIAWI